MILSDVSSSARKCFIVKMLSKNNNLTGSKTKNGDISGKKLKLAFSRGPSLFNSVLLPFVCVLYSSPMFYLKEGEIFWFLSHTRRSTPAHFLTSVVLLFP